MNKDRIHTALQNFRNHYIDLREVKKIIYQEFENHENQDTKHPKEIRYPETQEQIKTDLVKLREWLNSDECNKLVESEQEYAKLVEREIQRLTNVPQDVLDIKFGRL
jgi:DNA-binding transcriptional MerR regulator